MSDYGPPGGRYPGQPADPRGDPDRWDGNPASSERHSNGHLVALVVALLVLVLGGGAVAIYLAGRNTGPESDPDRPPATTRGPTAATIPSSERPPTTPAPEKSTDARFVQVGQCVTNDGGTDRRPKLAITRCASQTYEVLRRFDGATNGKQDATTKCSKVEGYTDWYFFNSDLDVLDFVLCLKLR